MGVNLIIGQNSPFSASAKWLLQDGTELDTLQELTTNANELQIIRNLTADVYIIGTRDASAYPYLRIVDAGGGSYTVGAAVQLEAAVHTIRGIHIISSTAFLVVTGTKVFACTVSGTTLTVGSGVALAGNQLGAVIQGNTTKTTFVHLHRTGTVVAYEIFTVSGTTVTAGGTGNVVTSLTSLASEKVYAATVKDARGVVFYTTTTTGTTQRATLFSFNEDGSGSLSLLSTQTTGNATSESAHVAMGDYDCNTLPVATDKTDTTKKYVFAKYAHSSNNNASWTYVKYNGVSSISLPPTTDNATNVWAEQEDGTVRRQHMHQHDQHLLVGGVQLSTTTEGVGILFTYLDCLNEGFPIMLNTMVGFWKADASVTSVNANTPRLAINPSNTEGLFGFHDSTNNKVLYARLPLPAAIQ